MQSVKALCAGSLRDVMEELAAKARFAAELAVSLEFGPSGVLRKRIEDGYPAGLLCSADMGHPKVLHEAGLAHAPRVFCGNAIRIMAAPGAEPPQNARTDPAALAAWLLRSDIRLSTSTPGADPSGDYAWRFFALAERAVPGARAALEAKAVKAVGGCGPKAIGGVMVKRPVVRLFEEDLTDVFIGYATTAAQTAKRIPGLHVVVPPEELAIDCPYGLAALRTAGEEAKILEDFMLSQTGRNIFAQFGFTLPPGS